MRAGLTAAAPLRSCADRARFMAEGIEGLTRDKTRKPGKQPLPTATVERVVELTLGPPPGEATHWTGRMLAKAAGVGSLRSTRGRCHVDTSGAGRFKRRSL